MASTELTPLERGPGGDGKLKREAGGPLVCRPADLVELAELTYRAIFSAGLAVACVATVYAAGLALLQPPGHQATGFAVAALLALAEGAALWQRVRLYSLLRSRPTLLLVAGVLIGAGSWAVGSHNQQMFFPLAMLIGSLGVAVSLRLVTVASLVAAAGIAAPHVVNGDWMIGNALGAAVLPPLFSLIVEQLTRFMLRLNRRLESDLTRPSARVRVRAWAYRSPARSKAAAKEESQREGSSDAATVDTPQIDPDILTSRQREVVLLVAEGLQNVEIARCLDIGAVQVGRHLARARKRAGVATDAELMAWAKRHGIVPPIRAIG